MTDWCHSEAGLPAEKSTFLSASRITENGEAVKITGHSDYKSMKPYIDITESAKRDAI